MKAEELESKQKGVMEMIHTLRTAVSGSPYDTSSVKKSKKREAGKKKGTQVGKRI